MKTRRGQGGYLMFWCPGCDAPHAVTVEGPNAWGWNANPDALTLTPSVLVTRRVDEAYRCHSFVRDGNIEFLGDCSHAMAGKTVPLPDWPAGYE
jgi:hypothetical protein